MLELIPVARREDIDAFPGLDLEDAVCGLTDTRCRVVRECEKFMISTNVRLIVTALFILPSSSIVAQNSTKTYKHAQSYQVAILDQTLRVTSGGDLTTAKTMTGAKLNGFGQGIHLLHTEVGDFRVEAPVNTGLSMLSTMGSNAYHPAQTIHNKWFLDQVQPGTKVLFASECAKPSKKHPNDVVRCTFWFPDPDSTSHEYGTLGDFTPYQIGDGSNAQQTANVLCGTGKLKPETEAQICGSPAAASAARSTTTGQTKQEREAHC